MYIYKFLYIHTHTEIHIHTLNCKRNVSWILGIISVFIFQMHEYTSRIIRESLTLLIVPRSTYSIAGISWGVTSQ